MTTRMMARMMALVLGLLLVLAGCSASTGTSEPGAREDAASMGDSGGMDAAADPAMVDADSAGDDAGGDPGGAGESGTDTAGLAAGETDADGQMMVRRVTLEVQVDDVTAAVTRARATATGSGGWVESEEVSPGDEERPGHASLVLRVPSEGLDSVLTDLGGLGTVTGSRTSADNVAAEYRDVDARIATLEASAERLRDLIGEATGIEAIASLERELSSREADLDGLKARLAVLADDVARSTITLHLAEDAADLGQTEERTGFVGGLQRGWDAFTASVTMLVTALGALLPFLVLAALVLVPVLWWRRRRTAAGAPRIGSKGDRQPDAAADPGSPRGDRS